MGSSSSALRSIKSHGSAQPVANIISVVKSHVSLDTTERMSHGFSSSPESEIINEDAIQPTHKDDTLDQSNKSNEHVSSFSTCFDNNDKNSSVINMKELTTTLDELSLPDHEKHSALQFLKDNPRLVEQMKISIDCILSFKSPTLRACMNSLEKQSLMYYGINSVERTAIGEFLTYLNFCQESYAKYVSTLKAHGLELFNGSLLDFEDEKSSVIMNILNHIRNIWWNFSDASAVFSSKIASEICIIQEMIQNISSLIGVDGKILKHSATYYSAMGIIHNVARLSDARRIFREMKLVDILANFLNYEDAPKVTMLVLMVLAHIIDEHQTHLLTSHDSVFDLMILLSKCAWKEDDHRYDGFSIEELIEAMIGLSRNDAVKKVLVKKGILTLLLRILTEGNEKEQELSMKLLWELSFDPENRIKIQQDEAMMQTVKKLCKHTNKSTARSAEGTLLVIGMEKNKEQSKGQKKKTSSKESKGIMGHIMISYNWKDQKKLIEIRDFLRNHGYKIWMDIDNIYGSTLQAMAEAVEQADVVLVCMSETYKESSNCRSEAEYAFTLQKPIIPLLMQSKYKPDGWLGILLGAKLFFNFSGKYPFEKKIDELMKEIGNRGKFKAGDIQDNIDGPIIKHLDIPLGKTPNILHPNVQLNVQEWIKEHNLTEFPKLQSLSPEHLYFMKKMYSRAPEFYYSFLLDFMSGKMSSQDLTNLMMVTSAIENISR